MSSYDELRLKEKLNFVKQFLLDNKLQDEFAEDIVGWRRLRDLILTDSGW